MKKRILFVCAGNTCRSPMAEILFLHMLKQAGLAERFEVSSAGLHAFPGDGGAPCAREAMAERSLDLSAHRSRLLSRELFAEEDWLVTMTQAQKQSVRQLHRTHNRVISLGEYADGDISDPYGENLAAYRLCAAKIERALEGFLTMIREEEAE